MFSVRISNLFIKFFFLLLVLLGKMVAAQTVDLTQLQGQVANVPTGATISWHTASTPSGANAVSNPSAAAVGRTYYMTFYDAINDCYSPTTSIATLTNDCPVVWADLTTLNARISNNPGVAVSWHSGAIATTANLVPNSSAVSGGVYYAAFYDAINDCYSEESTPVIVTIITYPDTDNDGVFDCEDLDDDNDGILDTDEGCLPESANFSINQNSMNISLDNGTDGIVLDVTMLDNGFNLSINGNQLTTSEIEFHAPVRTVEFADGTFYGGGGIPSIWSLAWNNPADMETPLIRLIVNTDGSVEIFGSKTRNGPLEPMVFVNGLTVNPVSWSATDTFLIDQIIDGNTVMSGRLSSLTSTCDIDTDGDGLTDNIDLDSDNDGCFDALEGDAPETQIGYTELNPDGSIAGAVDTNGVPNTASGGQGVGTSQDVNLQAVECSPCDVNNPNYVDTDGDLVGDYCDLDDDNDGVLDEVEYGCTSPSDLIFTNITVASPTATEVVANNGVDVSFDIILTNEGVQDFESGVDGNFALGDMWADQATDASGGDVLSISANAKGTYILSNNTTSSFGFDGGDYWRLTALGGFNVIDPDGQLNIISNSGNVIHFRPTLNIPANAGTWQIITESAVQDILIEANGNPWTPARLSFCSAVDTDGDNTPDYLDLDSDNDGIYDTVEAGGTDPDNDGIIGTGAITDTNFNGWSDIADNTNGGTVLPDTNTDGTGLPNRLDLDSDEDGCYDGLEAGFTDDNFDGVLGDSPITIDANGVVTSGTDGYTGTSTFVTDSTLQSGCLDNDNDGIANFNDLDDDNDGIYDTEECEGFGSSFGAPVNITSITGSQTISAGSGQSEVTLSSPTDIHLARPTFNGVTGYYLGENNDDEELLVEFSNPVTEVEIFGYYLTSRAGGSERVSFEVNGELISLTSDKFTTTNENPTITTDAAYVFGSDPGFGNFEYTLHFPDGISSIRILHDNIFGSTLGAKYELMVSGDILVICDADNDLTPNIFELDSDDDGCNDVIEAGFTDNNDDGILGPDPVIVDGNGVVTSGSDGYTTPADVDSNSTYDFLQASAAPTISTQPTNQTICLSCNGTFTATNTAADTFQWQIFNGTNWDNLTDTGIYSGTSTATLTVTKATSAEDNNRYRLLVSSSTYSCAQLTSDEVTLTVRVTSVITNRQRTYRVNKN